jgi:hypothetical protein
MCVGPGDSLHNFCVKTGFFRGTYENEFLRRQSNVQVQIGYEDL